MRVTTALITMILLVAVMVEGCIQPVDRRTRPDPNTPDVVEVDDTTSPNAKIIWHVLAERVETGKFRHSDELLGTIKELKEAGDLTDADVRKFNEAFRELLNKRRDLDTEDAKRLRSLALVGGTDFAIA